MSEEGKNLLNLIKETKKVYEQISMLLRTVDEQMEERDWEDVGGTVTSDKSGSLYNPEKWSPYFLFRYYTCDKNKNILAYVSVLIDDDVDEWYKIEEEPLITAGYFEYNKKNINGDDYYWSFAQWFGLMEKHQKNGKIESYKNWKEDLKKTGIYGSNIKIIEPIEKWKCFGLPLTSITNSQDIEIKIVTRLLGIISEK
jgi:hypothetical protein